MSNGWNFPPTGWGIEYGKNDPGLETFRGNPYPSLAREPIQNSLDAKKDNSKPVRVEFSVFKIKKEAFPGRDEYIEVTQQCIQSAKEGSETQKELENILEALEEEYITFIKISDYNTTGLSGSDQERNTQWHGLIRGVGESDKDSTSGGAFGIGKHAPFVCSNLKAVFYSTKDLEGKSAFQGVSKLITFEDKEGEPRQATGFYGEKHRSQPIKNMSDVSETFVRAEVGTDLYVAGFDYRDSWEDEIIEAVLSSFFVTIHEGNLEVKVGEQLINKASIGTFINELKSKGSTNKVINYYEVLTSTEPFIEENFENLGRIEFYVGNKNTYHRKVAMVRKTGMLIKEKPNNNTPEKYAGVLLIKGIEFNKELKRVENPTHTDWELKRKKDVKKIKAALNELDRWMNEKIRSISPLSDVTSINVDELAQFLPDENQEPPLDGEQYQDKGTQDTSLSPGKIKKINSPKKPNNPLVPVSDFDDDNDNSDSTKDSDGGRPHLSDNSGSGSPGNSGNGNNGGSSGPGNGGNGNNRGSNSPGNGDNGNNGGSNSPGNGGNGNNGGSNSPGNGGNGNNGGSNSPGGGGNGNSGNNTRIALVSRYKLFCVDPSSATYKLNVNVESEGKLLVKLFVIGEDSEDLASISAASLNGDTLTLNDGLIGSIYAKKGKNQLEFELNDKIRVAMGVTFNEE
ncbi:hypothetical protein [Exiguobacterium sp. R-39]|uniref:hypothetical protein n=1 Tax=Exiguobacterium sp. R-39 TaxID=3416708 RepID=UPI003CF7C93E